MNWLLLVPALLFYGVLLTGVAGLLAAWVDRKVTARVQYRVGPPLLQPAWDVLKLLGKETLVPRGAHRVVFLVAPLVAFAGVVLASTLIWTASVHQAGFLGDLIVALYLLVIPSIALILGASCSGNPLAALGASREIKMVLSYELPFVLAVFVPIIQSGYTLRLGEIVAWQAGHGFVAWSLSGAIALIVGLLAVQAKLGLVPFDAAEAETEIMGGILIEYGGPPLALLRLSRNMLLFTLPFFLVVLFLGGIGPRGLQLVWGTLAYVVLLALATVIRNTNPRLRIDQAMRFFWGPVTVAGILAVLLAFLGW